MFDAQKIIDSLRYQINRRFKYDIIRFSGQHTLRSHIAKIIETYRIESVIDVGANEGQFGASIRSLGFKGKIYSFEPVVEAYDKLSREADNDHNWFTFNFALGAEPGEVLINVSKHSSFSSILDANDYGMNNWENMELTHKEKIQIKTLDECVEDGTVSPKSNYLLKMDTQGYDLQVFKGAGRILPEVRCILSELSLIPLYHDMPNYMDSLSVYQEKGFSVSGIYPITRNKNLSLNEMDCMLVNTSFFKS